ncbi:MAG: STAS domain-containing protein, partial [Planctomycetota bacterium]
MSGMKLEETVHGDAIALSVRGTAGPGEGETLERAFADLAGKRHKTVVLDLAGLDYLSSFGIGCLIKLHRDVAEH